MVTVVWASDGATMPPSVESGLTGAGVDVVCCPLSLAALDLAGDVVVLDSTGDARTAARLAPLLHTRPVLALVDDASADAVGPAWGVDDVILVTATAAEWRLRLRLLAADADPARLAIANVVIDEAAYKASVAGNPLDLTYTEFELLRFLVANPNRVHSREHLLAEVWGQDYFGGTRTVDVHIRRLRAKLGPEHDTLIETVRNVGYRLAPR